MFITGIKLDEIGTTSYINELPVVRHLLAIPRMNLTTPVTFVVGENGSGKSTLVEAIAVGSGFNAEGGTRQVTFSTMNTESELHYWLTVVRAKNPTWGFFLRAESYYNVATAYYEFDATLPQEDRLNLHHRSHGESVMHIVDERFTKKGLYILDEPEAGLSPFRLMELLVRITRMAEEGSQFIIATHSPILLAVPGATILEITADGLAPVTYDQATIVQATREFLDNPRAVVDFLLDPED